MDRSTMDSSSDRLSVGRAHYSAYARWSCVGGCRDLDAGAFQGVGAGQLEEIKKGR